jgi:alpha-amylase
MTSTRLRLVMALHFHQPVGNFDTVFQDAVRLSYRPLVEHVERHPGVRAAFHLSGCLLEWLETHDRAFLDRVIALVGAGQVEPLGGGFYEPILTIIPREDALDQLARLASWWKRRSGLKPRGAWIAERVWEQGLAELLAEAGVEYTILDDQHLRFAGLLDERFTGVFVTERAGRPVAFFPSDFDLRYLIPFRPIETLRAHLLAAAGTAGDRPILTYGDDAEKFGLWPETHDWVYGKGWLESFFTMLEDPDGPAQAITPGAALDAAPPARKVYIPNASYAEMLEWALPATSVAAFGATRAAAAGEGRAAAVRAFVRGTLWDMFLARYPEADQLHKHVLRSSRRARALPPGAVGRAEAITAALRAECNCAYWHGMFGGIYYSHLRHGLYRWALDADARVAARQRRPFIVEVEDFDGDREREVILRSGRLQAFFRPADGGTLAELDDLETRFNVTNVLSRWKESYHEGADIVHAASADAGTLASPHERAVGIASADLEDRFFDQLPLRSLRDFVCDVPPDPRGLARLSGMTFLAGPPSWWEPTTDGFRMGASIAGFDYERVVTIETGGVLRVGWTFETAPAAWFGTLLCLSLLTPRDPDRERRIVRADGAVVRGAPGETAEVDGATGLILEDRAFGFALEAAFAPAARLVAAPIETLQRAEVRYETAYQGTLFALCWRLPPGSAESPADDGAPGIRLAFRSPGGNPGSPKS